MKEISDKEQNELVMLVCRGENKKAHELECKMAKDNLIAKECVSRLNDSLNAGIVCYKNNMKIPKWVENNRYLEQCYSKGWHFEQNRSLNK